MKNKMETQEKKRTPMKYMITGILCFLMAILYFIYIWNSCSVLVRISGFAMIIMLMFCGVIMIYGTNYIKKTEAEQYMIDKDIRSILRNKYCKKQKELQRKNKDMYRTIYRYTITKFLPNSVIIFLLVAFLWGAYFELYNYGKESRLFLYVIGIVGVVYYILSMGYVLFGGCIRKFKKYIIENGYDTDELNQDYIKGDIYYVYPGIINIGLKYTIYFCYGNKNFIILNDQINVVEKRIRNTEELSQTNNIILIRICTKQGDFEIVSKDIVSDVILEGFQLHGIETKMIDERTEQ